MSKTMGDDNHRLPLAQLKEVLEEWASSAELDLSTATKRIFPERRRMKVREL